MLKQLVLCALLLTVCTAISSYTVETRNLVTVPQGEGEAYANDLRAKVLASAQPSGYCTEQNPPFPLTNKSMCGAGQNIGWIFTFKFSDAEASNYQIEFGTDFTYGAGIWVDGVFQQVEKRDMWWANNWNSPGVFKLNYDLSAGEHEILVIGGEKCCDGNMDIRFQRQNAGFKSWNVENLNAEIPEPVAQQLSSANSGTKSSTPIRVHLSSHYTLDYALGFDIQSLTSPCQEPIEFDKAHTAINEWIELLSDPSSIQEDVDLLGKIRALIVAAKSDIQETEANFKKQTESFAQIKVENSAEIETQQIHRVFGDQMNQILAQFKSLNSSSLSHSELVQLADDIIAAIDKLVVELEDLQSDSANFAKYVDELTTTQSGIAAGREECHGDPEPEPEPIATDKKISSATLDDFEVPNENEGADSNNGNDNVNNASFSVNSGALSFAQKKSSHYHLRKNKQHKK